MITEPGVFSHDRGMVWVAFGSATGARRGGLDFARAKALSLCPQGRVTVRD